MADRPLPDHGRPAGTAAGTGWCPTRANGQPAFGCYLIDPGTPIAHAHGLLVLTLAGDRISALTRFIDNALLPPFGLPRTLRAWPARG